MAVWSPLLQTDSEGPTLIFGKAPLRPLPATVTYVAHHVLIFYTPPQTFNEHIVNPSAFAVHADVNTSLLENACEVLAGELGTLIGIEYLGTAMDAQRLFQGLDTKVTFQGIGKPPGQYLFFE